MDVSVVIGTFGHPRWANLAHLRALPSVSGAPVIHRHAKTLARARNEALALVDTEWVVHLDADDELDPGYVEAMRGGSADLRGPAVSYVRNGRAARPRLPQVAGHRHACSAECFEEGNWLAIGTCARTELIRQVGGWREWPFWEDFDLFRRCWKAGASIEGIPNAIYRAHVRLGSRNQPQKAERERVFAEIVA